MARMYTTDGKILTEQPTIQVGDKLYTVDNRKSTYDKMQAEVLRKPEEGETKLSEEEIIIVYALGEKQFKEIKALDLPISGYLNLIVYIYAAMFDITFEEAKKRFQL